MFRDEACIYDEVQDTQDDELQQNDAYSTQVLQLKQNVCYDSFFGENFQQQWYNYILYKFAYAGSYITGWMDMN